MGMRKAVLQVLFTVLAVLLTCVVALMGADKPAHAAQTFEVNSTADTDDGDCEPLIQNVFLHTDCTLREAINAANDTTDQDAITFNIPASDPGYDPITEVLAITPNSALPTITEQVTIDGYTQPGAVENNLARGTNASLAVELDGSNLAPGDPGLNIQAPNCLVKGLVINRFNSSGIYILAERGTRIEGNFIGTDPSGTSARPNFSGVQFQGGAGVVGGTSPAARNLISGNNNDGLSITGVQNMVEGNLIGTQRDGISPLGNGDLGVKILNRFSPPILTRDSNTVGSADAAAANVIAFNGGPGVAIHGSSGNGITGNRILGNSIFSNGGLGIDLGNDGPTANDPDDPDTGANNFQNHPVLASATKTSTGTIIKGRLDSTPGKIFKVQFFANPSGTDQGKTFVGQKKVTTDASGHASFTFKPANIVRVGRVVTATATDPKGNTSEFSAARSVVKG